MGGACASYSRCAPRRRAVTGYCVGSRKCCGPECKEEEEEEKLEEEQQQPEEAREEQDDSSTANFGNSSEAASADGNAEGSEDIAKFAVEMVLAVHNAALQAQNESTHAIFRVAIAGAFGVDSQAVAVAFTNM